MTATSYFLLRNPNPHQHQFNSRRRVAPWGTRGPIPQIVLHTYEAPHTRSLLAAATYFATRKTPGSYHWLCGDDSPTDVMPLAPVTAETWHCIPSNPWSIGVSAVAFAHQWNSIPGTARTNLIKSMAFASAQASLELIALGKSPVPARWITREEAMRGVWGFTYHRTMDPGRRTDPANPEDAFPWKEFLAEYTRLMGTALEGGVATPSAPDTILEAISAMNVYVFFEIEGHPHSAVANLLTRTWSKFPSKAVKDQFAIQCDRNGIPRTWHSSEASGSRLVAQPEVFGQEVPWNG